MYVIYSIALLAYKVTGVIQADVVGPITHLVAGFWSISLIFWSCDMLIHPNRLIKHSPTPSTQERNERKWLWQQDASEHSTLSDPGLLEGKLFQDE